MDYVTRQFINLVKHFRKDLRKAIADLNRTLDKLTKAIRERHKASDGKNCPPPELTAIVNLPKSIEIHQSDPESRRERQYKNRTLLVSVLTLIAIVIYAALVYLQYREMIEATGAAERSVNEARLNRIQADREFSATVEQFHLNQRAWVGVNISQFSATKNGDGTIRFVASGVIRNSGNTPALKVTEARTIEIKKPSSELIDYDKEWDAQVAQMKRSDKSVRKSLRKTEKSSPAFAAIAEGMEANHIQKWYGDGGAIAPNSEFHHSFVDATLPDPRPTIVPPTETIYWIGRIAYHDIFSDKSHTTKFCIWYADGVFELCPTGNLMD